MLTSAPKISLEDSFSLMRPEHQRVAQAIYEDYKNEIDILPGSATKHQVWKGGYRSHVEETMNIVLVLFHQLNMRRPLPFDVSTALFISYIHDFDKLLRYYVDSEGKAITKNIKDKDYTQLIQNELDSKYGYILTDEETNGLKYTHGEINDYQPGGKRLMGPLATLVHCADVISARLWHDYGHSSDTWKD